MTTLSAVTQKPRNSSVLYRGVLVLVPLVLYHKTKNAFKAKICMKTRFRLF